MNKKEVNLLSNSIDQTHVEVGVRRGLVFEGAWKAPQGLPPNWHSDRPRVVIPSPQAAWLEWNLEWPDAKDTIAVSLCMNQVEDLWLWMVALAHRMLPATIWFDEEGSRVALSAQRHDDGDDLIHLTLQRVSDHWEGPNDNFVLARHDWTDSPGRFLRRIGRLMAVAMAEPQPIDWGYSSALWIPLETMLPWHWPGHVAQWNLTSPWSDRQQQAWLYLSAAVGLDVNHGRHPASVIYTLAARTALARLEYQGIDLSVRWMKKSADLLGIAVDAKELTNYKQGQADRLGLFEDVDEWCNQHRAEGGTLEQALGLTLPDDLNELTSSNVLWHSSERAHHHIRHQLLDQVMTLFDWQPGTWVRDEQMHPGRVVLHARDTFLFESSGGPYTEGQQKCLNEAMSYTLVDWGHNGITREYQAMGLWSLNLWRWPVVRVDDFEPGTSALYERWRVWATHPVTSALPCTCPACGYLHLEDDDPIEIHGCPYCGEYLSRSTITSLHPPHERPDNDWSGGADRMTLHERRQRVLAHGDVYALEDDSESVTWLRRPDVKALRKRLTSTLDEWLDAPEPKLRLPLDLWQTLEWSGRSFDSPLYRTGDDDPMPSLVPQQPTPPKLTRRQRRLKLRGRKKRRVGEFFEWALTVKAHLRLCNTESDMDVLITEWLSVVDRLGLGFGGGFDWRTGLIDGALALAGRGGLHTDQANVALDCLAVHADVLEVEWVSSY